MPQQLDLFHETPERASTPQPRTIAPRQVSPVRPLRDRRPTSRSVTRRIDNLAMANDLAREAREERILEERGEETIVAEAYL